MLSRVPMHKDRRGAVAIMLAVAMPVLLAAAGMAVDVGIWYREQTRLQIAADAAAMGAARLLSVSTAKQSDYQAAGLLEAQAVTSSSWIGTLSTPIAVSVASNSASVTVTLTSTADRYLTVPLGIASRTLTATATAGSKTAQACVLALSKSASPGIQVDNMGSIVANGCSIFSDSTSSQSIYLNSGTISGSAVGAAGGIVTSNSGSNDLSPSGTPYSANQSDPNALSTPSYGGCNYTNYSATSYGTYTFNSPPYVFCGNTTFGGNGSTDSFAPGTYYVVNGNLTFQNAIVTQATGVTFILTGSSPGGFNWINNNAATLTAPTSGTYSGVLLWQTCPSSGSAPVNQFNNGSQLQISGEIYTPCGETELLNNAKITPTSGGTASLVANQVYVTGSASITTSEGTSAASSQISLIQ